MGGARAQDPRQQKGVGTGLGAVRAAGPRGWFVAYRCVPLWRLSDYGDAGREPLDGMGKADASHAQRRRNVRAADATLQAGRRALRAAPRYEAEAVPCVARAGSPPEGASRAAASAPPRA